MRCQLLWNISRSISSSNVPKISLSPDGTTLLTGAWKQLQVHDANSGTTLSTIPFSEEVHAVAHAAASGRIASGDASGQVTVLDGSGQSISTFQHGLPIVALSFSSTTGQLASATSAEVSLWSPEDGSVKSHEVVDRVTQLVWSPGGALLAAGAAGASISIYDTAGARLAHVPSRSAVSALAWNLLREGEDEQLVVGCTDGSLSFFAASGFPVAQPVLLGSSITALASFASGDLLCIACGSGRVGLHSSAGAYLAEIAQVDSWVAHIATEPRGSKICIACQDGSLAMLQLTFSTMHALHQDVYASRQALTRVALRDMATGARATVDCGAPVRQVAVCPGRLAVQLSEQLLVYAVPPECFTGGPSPTMIARIRASLPCNLLLVTAHHVLLCQDREVQLLSLEGRQEGSWATNSLITYARVVGGHPGSESAVLGCQDGIVLQVFCGHPCPIRHLQHSCAIRCLDLSRDAIRLALVDERDCLYVYEAKTGAALWSVEGADSAAWNGHLDGVLAWSHAGRLCTKSAALPAQCHAHNIQGAVVGFSGCMVYCLQGSTMHSYPVRLPATELALPGTSKKQQASQGSREEAGEAHHGASLSQTALHMSSLQDPVTEAQAMRTWTRSSPASSASLTASMPAGGRTLASISTASRQDASVNGNNSTAEYEAAADALLKAHLPQRPQSSLCA